MEPSLRYIRLRALVVSEDKIYISVPCRWRGTILSPGSGSSHKTKYLLSEWNKIETFQVSKHEIGAKYKHTQPIPDADTYE